MLRGKEFENLIKIKKEKGDGMEKKILVAVVMAVVVAFATAARAGGEIVQMPEHGSLWQMAQECGQLGAAWPAIATANPWLKVKMVKGRPVVIVYPGQPIMLPEGWSLGVSPEAGDEENGVDTTILAALWADTCNMAKNYPMPTILLMLAIFAVSTARSVVDEWRKRHESAPASEPEIIRPPRFQRGQWESVLLPR